MFKILSIDGGGMHGYADIIIMKRLMDKFPELINNADLIAGTSIGGIIGLGLAMDHDITKIDNNFIRGIPLAFNTNPMRLIGFYAGLCPKYDNSKFKIFLRCLYGNITLGQLTKKVVVPTFCLDDESPVNRRWRAKIFHNFESLDSDADVKLVDVAMATSAVPVFFSTYDKYVDGALIANNPSLCAVAQTQDPRNVGPISKMEEIVVLSIGSIRNIYIADRTAHWGYLMWARSIFHMLTERDTLVVNHMAKLLLQKRFHRVEPVINGPMDNFDELPIIKTIGENYPIENTVNWLNEYWV